MVDVLTLLAAAVALVGLAVVMHPVILIWLGYRNPSKSEYVAKVLPEASTHGRVGAALVAVAIGLAASAPLCPQPSTRSRP